MSDVDSRKKQHFTLILLLIGALFLNNAGICVAASAYSYSSTIDYLSNQIPGAAADPTIYQENGKYYLYFTGGANNNSNAPVWTSTDFVDWTYSGEILANNLFNTPGKTKWDNPLQPADYLYYWIWSPVVKKLNNGLYVAAISAEQASNSHLNTWWNEGINISNHGVWFAFSNSPGGPFGPSNGYRMNDPLPLRNLVTSPWFNTNPHTDIGAYRCTTDNCIQYIDLGDEFFEDNGNTWLIYSFYEAEHGNVPFRSHLAMVKLDPNDISLTNQTNPEYYRLSNAADTIYDPNGKSVNACYLYSNGWNACINEAPVIIKRNGKYIMFYSVKPWDTSYTTVYKMANSLSCLIYGQESNASCGVKQGIAFDGTSSSSIYTYGSGELVVGPDGQQLFHLLTVMRKNDSSMRTIWAVEQQFNNDGTPKYSTPQPTDKITINLNQPLTCSNQTCDNNPADGIVDANKTCIRDFNTTYQNDAYKTMSFSNGWTQVNGEWMANLGSGWYWAQGSCTLGTYPRFIYINTTTGVASGDFNCAQNGQNYCASILCTDADWSYIDGTCQSNNTLTRTWTKIGNCTGGTTHSATETITCTYTPPACTNANWASTDGNCQSNNSLTRTWIKIGTCIGGETHPATETVSCSYTAPNCTANDFNYSEWMPATCPQTATQTRTATKLIQCNGNPPEQLTRTCTYNAPICTDFNYASWSTCTQSGTQTRGILSSLPAGCEGGNPLITQTCTYVPLCTESNWVYNLNPKQCPDNNTQTKTWTMIGNCSAGVTHPASETASCNPTLQECTALNYSQWGNCAQNGIQTRTITHKTPDGCAPNNPTLTKECTYPPSTPSNQCTNFTYSNWTTCSSTGTRTRNILTSSPNGCTGGNPEPLNQSCTPTTINTCTEADWTSTDGSCQSNNSLTRTWAKTTNCVGGVQHDEFEEINCSQPQPWNPIADFINAILRFFGLIK